MKRDFRSGPLVTPMTGMELNILDEYTRHHHGLITRAAAARLGVSRSAWYRAVRSGLIEPVHPNVARMVGTLDTPEQRIAAAVLACPTRALASHRSAAFLWGVLRIEEVPVDIILTGRGRESSLQGVIAHRPRDLLDLTPVLRTGIRTTNVLRTLCDLGAVDRTAVPGAVGHVVTYGLASPVALRRAIERHARRGRHGVPALRDALDDWVIDAKPVDSVLEPAMEKLLARFGLPKAEFHAVIGGYEVDFWIPGTPIVLECDGWETHGRDRRTFESDRVRDADLTALGYIPVRFTYRQITRQPRQTAQRIESALRRWCPELHPGGVVLGFRD